METIKGIANYIDSLDGYTIADTHFKIGAKYHSTTFVYAKRLFHNSFYTSRIAMTIANDIISILSKNNQSKLTLIGYEMYSELLLNLVKKYLVDYGIRRVDVYIMVASGSKMRPVPNNTTSIQNYVVVIPIVSTGSTARKITNAVQSHWNISVSPLKYYNVISIKDPQKDIKCDIDNVKTLVQLETKWYDPSDCPHCFNNDISRPIIETDNTALVPTLLFEIPRIKELKDIKDTQSDDSRVSYFGVPFKDVSFQTSLQYKHEIRNGERWIYSINSDLFIKDNIKLIKEWLCAVKCRLNISHSNKNIIMAPCHYSNMTFINLVNSIVFDSTATILYHQSDADYAENFRLFNKEQLLTSSVGKVCVYYVDDVLVTGNTFFNIYDLFRFTVDYKSHINMAGAIFLRNQAPADITTRVGRASNNAFYFVSINSPLSYKVVGNHPLELEINRYRALSESCMYNISKTHYKNRANELSQFDKEDDNPERHLNMFISIHYIYEAFSQPSIINNWNQLTFRDICDYCRARNKNHNDDLVVLKVLTQHPFILYQPVLNKVYDWYKAEMDDLLNSLSIKIQEGKKINVEDVNRFKFFTRRSIFIKNNILVSEKYITVLSKLLELIDYDKFEFTQSFVGDIYQVTYQKEKHTLETLPDFMLFQYIELSRLNSWTATKVMDQLNRTDVFTTKSGLRFKRMLINEMAYSIEELYYMILTHYRKAWVNMYNSESNMINEDEDNVFIKEFFKINNIKEKNKYKIAGRVIREPVDCDAPGVLLNYLWIKQFIYNDIRARITQEPLTQKTNILFKKLRRLFSKKCPIGAFMIIVDGAEQIRVVYDQDLEEKSFITDTFGECSQFFLDLISDKASERCLYEFKTKDDQWLDIHYGLSLHGLKVPPSANYLLLMRIKDGADHTGVIGFYSAESLQDNMSAKQCLMSLRKDIAKYIKYHHKNEEFTQLYISQLKNRFAYLAGHGREVMRSLSDNHDQIRPIIRTMEQLQFYFASRFHEDNINYYINKDGLDEREIMYNVFSMEAMTPRKLNIILDEIKEIAKVIYTTEIVECCTKVKVDHNILTDDSERQFYFNEDLLMFICFELIVNAKKNRFHMLPYIYNDCYSDEKAADSFINEVYVEFAYSDRTFDIKVSGTGPKVLQTTMNAINSGLSVKQYEEIAGLRLIRELIKRINNSNQIKLSSVPYTKMNGVYYNTLTIRIQYENFNN